MNKNEIIKNFWEWFQKFEAEIYVNYSNPEFMRDVDAHVNKISPDLSWEIGPIDKDVLYFSLSPEMDDRLMGLVEKAVSHSYKSKLWKLLI